MIFWDTSSLVPLIVQEPRTARAEKLLADDADIIAWWGTVTECRSAIARLEREEIFCQAEADGARAGLDRLAAGWHEVAPSELVREHADRLLMRHPLRAADALQLGAAMVWARGRPTVQRFCTADARMMEAARKEGFRVVRI